ncbi:hypothetical protein EAH75_04455 [Rhodanobacter glycinis]|uniref:hypothetical protein n=1 Tax=Rhodanobacter glycinis TaxID=582702 RepID=UPI0011260605|nr:hypothetical protein [Rhodanobacter glycinis]TPG50696.1 hypothetical protein EAH75_04455 [Rhodanobacter glycinis]
MHASAETAALPDIMQTPLGLSAKAFVLNQATRFMATRGSYRCKACGTRCEVEVQYDGAKVVHSKGQCRTPGCIGWEE